MVQFNLLPDVKLQYVKARQTKRLVTLISIGASCAALFVLLLLLVTVDVVQKKNLNDLNSDIKKDSTTLKAVPDLDKILTVQNQLNTLTGLHDQKAVTSRLFTYISQFTPTNASISKLTIDHTANILIITGEAPSLDTVDAFVNTLKATDYGPTASKGQWTAGTTYVTGDIVQHGNAFYTASSDNSGTSSNQPGSGKSWKDDWTVLPHAFSSVVLAAFGRDSKGATYTINLAFDPLIFSSTNDTILDIPSGTTGSPTQLFQKQAGN